MGREDFSLIYTNLDPEAGWRQTLWTDKPYDIEPSLTALTGYTEQYFITSDVMHNWHMGCLRDLLGSTIKVLCKAKNYFDGSTVDKRLGALYREAKAWAKENRVQLSLRWIKKTTVLWRSDVCPELRCSASDAGVMHRFLLHKLLQKPPPRYPGLTVALWSADAFISVMAKGSLFLTEAERHHIYETGFLYCRSFLKLANEANANGELLFKLRPKYHHMTHHIMEAKDRPSSRNAMWDAVFMDEDYIKWTTRMTRSMSAETAALNVLRRYRVVTRQALLKSRG